MFLLSGAGRVPLGTQVSLAGLAGCATLLALLLHEYVQAIAAFLAAVGFTIGLFADDPFLFRIAAALTILGGVGFVVSSVWTAARSTAKLIRS